MVQPEPSTNPPVVLITGGTGGIGATVAEAFASAGADVIATGIDNDELTAFGQSYPHIRCFKLDVTRDDSVAQVVHGLKRLSVLVNAAGILLREGKEYTLPAFDQVLDVNLSGVMRVSLACRDLLARESGCIVNVASMLSYFGSGFVPAYSASKGGVAQLTRSLAIGWAPLGIRVNAVAPGWIRTPMTRALYEDASRSQVILDRTPLGRWGEPRDVAGAVMFLCSPAAHFITGVLLPIDGGYSVA
ncbi:MAG: SDR family oxidoreductase [Planctomycetes bacterium]|nr:SDR family oxidoreductase [Planctomycetota bacterium]